MSNVSSFNRREAAGSNFGPGGVRLPPPGSPKLPAVTPPIAAPARLQPMNHLQTALETAQEVLAEARRRQAIVVARATGAAAAYTDAADGRARLVADAARGTDIAPKAFAHAEIALKTAEAEKKLWDDARAEAGETVAVAEKPVLVAMAALHARRFAEACKSRIDAAAALDRAAAEFGAKHSAWIAAGDEIAALHHHAFQMHEIENLRDARQGLWALPSKILAALMATPNGTQVNVEQRDRGTWGQSAAALGA